MKWVSAGAAANQIIREAIIAESEALRVQVRTGLKLPKDASFLVMHKNAHGVQDSPLPGLWTWNGEALDKPLHAARAGTTNIVSVTSNNPSTFVCWELSADFVVLLERKDLDRAGFKSESTVTLEAALRQLFAELKGQVRDGKLDTAGNKP